MSALGSSNNRTPRVGLRRFKSTPLKGLPHLARCPKRGNNKPLSPDKAIFLTNQLAALYKSAPLFLLCHVVVSAVLAMTINGQKTHGLAIGWLVFTLLPALAATVLYIAYYRHPKPRKIILQSARWIDFLAVCFGLCWASFPFLFLHQVDTSLRLVVLIILLAASAVGTLAFLRLPSAAIAYLSLVTGAMVMNVPPMQEISRPLISFFILIYGFIMVRLVVNFHREHLRQARAREEIHSQKQTITHLLNDFERDTRDWLWECDRDYRLVQVSRCCLETLGLPIASAVGKTLEELVKPLSGSQEGWFELYEKLYQGEAFNGCQIDVVINDIPGRWQLSARPFHDGQGQFIGYRGIGRDITQEWDTAQKLVIAKEAAEAASSAKSHFLAVMSHELRTPLNAIVGFAEVLSAPHDVPLETRLTREYATTILESSRHLQTLINDILDATRIEKNSVTLLEQESDAAELIEIAVRMCRNHAENADVTLVAHLLEDVEMVVDMTRIKQVVLNLLTNAIKFSPQGGIVNIDLSRRPNNDLQLAIRDSGIGVRPEDRVRIFEPFVQAEDGMARRFSGIGLGLSIARKIALLHGGDIVLESEYGAGTTVIFTLPSARVHWPKVKPKHQEIVAA